MNSVPFHTIFFFIFPLAPLQLSGCLTITILAKCLLTEDILSDLSPSLFPVLTSTAMDITNKKKLYVMRSTGL